MTEAIDRFLALCLRCGMRGDPLPPWPPAWPTTEEFHDAAFARVAFHGVALALWHDPAKLAGWPAQLRDQVGSEARLQSFWETGHREVLTRLLAALAKAGTKGVITKGTAVAYSAYPEPALRRRGDSDLLLGQIPRKAVRRVLSASGFRREGDARPLQENWAGECAMGFVHVFDLHWRINASAVLAGGLERGGIGTRSAALPRLCDGARAIAPADNLILIAMNRASHENYGYQSGDTKVFDQGRLIWALDLDRLCAAFSAEDWQHLLATAEASGTAPVVLAALDFAEATMGTAIPPDIKAGLARQPGDPRILQYLGAMRGIDRLLLDLSDSPRLIDKARLARYVVFPGTELLHERFPDAAHWPVPALQGRRMVAGIGKMLRPRP